MWHFVAIILDLWFWSGTIAIFVWLFKEVTMGICYVEKSMEGKIVLITGGNGGLGFQTALDLAKRGAEVIITARNMKTVRKLTSKLVYF